MAASKVSVTSRRWTWCFGLVCPLALGLSGCSADISSNKPGAQNTGGSGSSAGGSSSTGGATVVAPECVGVHPGRAQVRRLTRFEYNNAVNDLLGDATQPANAFPPETIARTGNLFGNDAALLSVSSLLAAQWGTVAADIAARATATPTAMAKLSACAGSAAPDDTCTRTLIQTVGSKAYHRDLASAEVDSFLALEKSIQATSTYASGVAAVLEAILQGPEFLYRIEIGAPAANHPELRQPTADEMAARLSFMFWGTLPDDQLRTAAKSGMLSTPDQIKAQAQRLVDAPQARPVVRFFFDNLLPIAGLTNLARSTTLYPAWSGQVAANLHEETQSFLEHTIFDADSAGTWAAALTAPYTYVNGALATYYGIPGITGTDFQKVTWPDAKKRMGLLTQAGILAGTITTDTSNPVLRGSFIINKILCMNIQLPTDPAILAQVKVPEGVTGATARERFTKHRAQPICAGCHGVLDPVGFSLENYDAVGQWRDQEGGETIDASGNVPGTDGTVNGPVELAAKIATAPAANTCFAQHWMEFGYGKTLDSSDSCVQAAVNDAFQKSGGNVKQLLVNLTQTDNFLYLPAKD